MKNSLHVDIQGQGEHLLLLHGWGMHSGLWGEFLKLLSENFTTHAIDLAGFGYSNEIDCDFSLDTHTTLVEEYIEGIQAPVNVLAWSMGGLVLLNILKNKNTKINKVVLVATTPCFTKKNGWEHAIDPSVFEQFSNDLKDDFNKTLKRFLSLQTRGGEREKETARELKEKLSERGSPNIAALEQGLQILSETDFRKIEFEEIDKIKTQTMLLLGEKDTLVPVTVLGALHEIFENILHVIVENAGHAPFITKSEYCAEQVTQFLNE